MTDVGRDLSTGSEEEATGRLLRTAGPRAPVSADRAARVRSAVRVAWQTQRHRRAIRRRLGLAAALLGVGALVVFAGRGAIPDRIVTPLGEPVAVVEAVDGTFSGLQRADAVHVGQWIETGSAARVALRFGRDSSVRIDLNSRLRALSSSIIELTSGAVYVDTGQEHRSFEIQTPLGTARDLGTQFELRLAGQLLRLRVRTGLVELMDHAHSISGRAGTEITLAAGGTVTRAIAPNSPEWAWVNRVSPPLKMEGVSLAAFLASVAREQGWTVAYADPALARKAETTILHGSATDLSPHEAVEVAIATSGLRHRLSNGSVVVVAADPSQPAERGTRQ